jgi:putative sugar O-methyltransferase
MTHPLVQTLARRLRRGVTSIADQTDYPEFCRRAARDDSVLATFKRQEIYRAILEHVTPQDGQRYLDQMIENRPDFVAKLDFFRENDRIGAPYTHDYGAHGEFSPTTLRYAKVLSDLVNLFGPLDDLRIVEIGGGYGGQCLTTSKVSQPASYTLIDLDPVLELQQRYLAEHEVTGVEFVRFDELDPGRDYDLVISNYAFSELVRSAQRRYMTAVLKRSARGYLTYNWMAPERFSRSYSRKDLLKAIPSSRFAVPTPQLASIEELWLWGMARRA